MTALHLPGALLHGWGTLQWALLSQPETQVLPCGQYVILFDTLAQPYAAMFCSCVFS